MSDLLLRPVYTLRSSVTRQGVGLFTGEGVTITLSPLQEGSGVVFERVDVSGHPKLRLDAYAVQQTPRCTVVGNAECSVQTVEHLLAALHAYAVYDVLIQLTGSEVPIFDGSSSVFVEMIEEAGLEERGKRLVRTLRHPVFFSQGQTHLVALPSSQFIVSYTLHYPHSACLGTQFFSFALAPDLFKEEVAPCRTFALYEEVVFMQEKGWLKGGSLETAVVIKDGAIVNEKGLRFPEEMARHKVLDLVGDLFCVGPFAAHVLAIRSGHNANNRFAQELVNHFTKENM